MDIDKIYKEGLEAQHKVNGTKEVSGQIQDKEAFTGKSGGPKGHFYLNGDKYTCWDDNMFAAFNKGDQVTIIFKESENEWKGRVFVNRTVVDINKITERFIN